MSHHNAQCHCGNITLSFANWPANLTSCNCSVCRRYGTLWGYYEPDSVTVSVLRQPTTAYQWGDGFIDFHHCPECGCVTHFTSTDKSPTQKVAINFKMVAPEEISTIHIRYFDGADSWKYLND
ncbi:GFA family protein [Vibrio mediterranei]|uniref:Aldehyde-activating protein n=1 Tax=Vibrio mediterranei TaxID=689 RepID=A0AAN1FI76_9VIBR|nr:aldehyde-activating protein [Vibrio mediterranei]ASI91025.1 aldehyde-activating protein [Vibrio mediterranei]